LYIKHDDKTSLLRSILARIPVTQQMVVFANSQDEFGEMSAVFEGEKYPCAFLCKGHTTRCSKRVCVVDANLGCVSMHTCTHSQLLFQVASNRDDELNVKVSEMEYFCAPGSGARVLFCQDEWPTARKYYLDRPLCIVNLDMANLSETYLQRCVFCRKPTVHELNIYMVIVQRRPVSWARIRYSTERRRVSS
jgi:hypothetical protein